MKSHNIKKLLIFFCTILMAQFLNGQTPTIRKITPVRQDSKINKPLRNPVNTDTTPTVKLIIPVKTKVVTDAFANYFSLLQFADVLYDPDCRTCKEWVFSKNYTHEINSNESSKNWKRGLMWRKIPNGAVYGKWEISTLPFSTLNDPGFTGIIRTGIIETKSADSVYFEINYIDAENTAYRSTQKNQAVKNTLPRLKLPNNVSIENKTRSNNDTKAGVYANNLSISSMKLFGDEGVRKFYIRMIPLDAAKQPLQKISNDISVQEKFFKGIQPAKQQAYLANDYTITAVKYVPIDYGNPAYSNCTIITSYNTPIQPNKTKQEQAFGFNDNNVFSMSTEKFDEYFQAAFPVGTVLCPQPPKEKAWYEKAFDGVTGFVTKTYDGAANFYNETKTYLKDKFKEINCNSNLVTTVVNPVTKLQQAAGPEVCETISGAAFDYGMAAVGIPPSLPTSDEFTKLAEGQIVDLACDNLEAQTGLPVPDEAREAIRKEFHDKVVAQSNKGVVNCGSFNVKPDPRGQFKTAYLEIEITRTGDAYKGKGIVGFGVDDVTTKTIQAWNPTAKKNETIDLKGNLFEHTTAQIPFLDYIGDKTKIYIILKPQESYTWKDKQTGTINSVHNSPQLGEYYTPATPTYEGCTHSPGFQLLGGKEANIKFSLGLHLADGIELNFKTQ